MTIREMKNEIEREQAQIDHSLRLLAIDSRYYFPQLDNLKNAVNRINLWVRLIEKEASR